MTTAEASDASSIQQAATSPTIFVDGTRLDPFGPAWLRQSVKQTLKRKRESKAAGSDSTAAVTWEMARRRCATITGLNFSA